jgi:hypothetical protein
MVYRCVINWVGGDVAVYIGSVCMSHCSDVVYSRTVRHTHTFLILSSHLRLGLPNGLFPSGFPTNTLCFDPTYTV